MEDCTANFMENFPEDEKRQAMGPCSGSLWRGPRAVVWTPVPLCAAPLLRRSQLPLKSPDLVRWKWERAKMEGTHKLSMSGGLFGSLTVVGLLSHIAFSALISLDCWLLVTQRWKGIESSRSAFKLCSQLGQSDF